MPESPNPGAGGSYRYNPDTDRVELVDFTFDPYSPPHPGADEVVAEPPADDPAPVDSFDPLA